MEHHEVVRPKYPVIDMHTHFGPMVLGKDYASQYDTADAVAKLKDAGIRKVATLGRWGIYGIGLTDGILQKVYHLNSERILKL